MRGTIEVHRYLTERSVPHEFYRLGRPLRRLEEAAALLGLPPAQLAEATLFEGTSPPATVLAIAPVRRRVPAAAMAEASGTLVRRATQARARELTGFLASWLPPVGHECPSTVFLEETLVRSEVLYTTGGDPGVMLVIRSADLLRATAASVAAFVGDASTGRERAPAEGTGLLAG